jgi:iron complex outermembrane receptor protein
MFTTRSKLLAVSIASITAMYSMPSLAQEDSIEEVVSIGTRADGRSVTQSVAPIDVIGVEELTSRGDSDMSNILRQAIPSYNVNDQPISDAATVVRPANLRGLAPDQTLVMVNGKRRHRAAVIAFLGGGLSDGAQGADISVIPASALKQVEVLRDGAAAQYGSDAIAGVINFVLRDDAEGGSAEVKLGSTYEGDGNFYTVAVNNGFALGSQGFANLTFEYGAKDPTSRSVQRSDAAGLIAGGNTDVANPAQVWGQPETRGDLKVFLNTGIDIGDGDEVYAFGNYARRTVEGGFFFRNPTNRGGIYSNDGGATDLIGDISGNYDASNPGASVCAGLTHQQAQSVADCFSFTEMFPGGFTPSFGADVVDLAGVMGFRGEVFDGINYDVSYGAGYNEAAFFISNTVNPSLGPNTPTSFQPGTYIQLENNFNVDLSKAIGAFNVAGGFEWREESFEAKIGDIPSWENGPLTEQGFGIGSNGFQGFGSQVVGEWSRENVALYTDVEWTPTDALLLGAALRWEDYDSFGSTTNWKLSARYDFTENFALRATASTGFRAPTPGQANVVNTTTASVSDGMGGQMLVDQGTIAPTTAMLINSDAEVLQPEESENLSVGIVANFGDLDLTLDVYSIDVTGRIALTDTVPVSAADRQILIANGVPGAEGLAEYRFFANDFDTETRGLDFVATYGLFDTAELSLVYNYNKTEVVGGSLGAGRIRQLEENLPEHRANLSYRQDLSDSVYVMARANYYSSIWEAHLDDPTLPIDIDSAITFDAEIGYTMMDNLSVIAGVSNLTDEAYDNPWADIVGAQYAVTSPYGFQGGSYYVRMRYEF